MKAGRYKEGERNRQAILDYLHDHPGALATEIIPALGIERQTGSSRLAKMVYAGELKREKAYSYRVMLNGKDQRTATYAYWPTVEKTRSQADVAETLASNVRRDKLEPVDQSAQKWIGGSFRNTRSDRPVTQCPDAMNGVGFRGMTHLEAAV